MMQFTYFYISIILLLLILVVCNGLPVLSHNNSDLLSQLKKRLSTYNLKERTQIEDLSSSPGNKIPRFFHFIWVSPGLLGNATMPSSLQENMKSFEVHNPLWQTLIWNNNLIKYTFPELAIHLLHLNNTSQMSDIIRYHILEQFGGVYLDTDIISIRNITPIVIKAEKRGDGVFTVCELPQTSTITNSECKITCTAVIGARAHHPVLSLARAKVMETLDECWEAKTTGPVFWTKIHQHAATDILILPARSFYPCHWVDKTQCILHNFLNQSDVYAMHMWSHSWSYFNGQCNIINIPRSINVYILFLLILIFAIVIYQRRVKRSYSYIIYALMQIYSKLKSTFR